ncbi:MAG: hypothetical protein CVU29_10210 [Betaproteobacteria bacterium HGW-Betaproteobacteria-22]|nr:MAG: hypothetical protein CVU29_10210 [Betaproteobacteria bacterium HGW-Betaproteobacteria-22]
MSRVSTSLLLLVVICSTLIPRLILIGAPPATDEGIYAFNALMIHLNPKPGLLIPDVGTLNFYPMLLSWVFGFEWNHFVALRLFDAVIASIAGLLLYKLIVQESRHQLAGSLIAIATILTLNDPVFIQFGFKNSIFAATIPLLMAILIGIKAQPTGKEWFGIGVLIAICVLLREPFVIFAILGVLFVYVKAGLNATLRYILGGITAALVALILIILLRGGVKSLLQAYFDVAILVDAMGGSKNIRSIDSLFVFFKNAIGLLILVCLVLSLYCFKKLQGEKLSHLGRYVFWILLATAPLLEPSLKNGFPYHYAVCLIGLSGLIALGYRDALFNFGAYTKFFTYGLIVLISITLLPKSKKIETIYQKYTKHLALYAPFADWPDKIVNQSNYLTITRAINNNSNKNATLSVHGNLLGLIPLTKLKPPHYTLSNLSYAYLYNEKSTKKLHHLITSCPPDVVVITSSASRDFYAIFNVVVESKQYKPIAYIPKSKEMNYGNFDGLVFKHIADGKPCAL